MPRPLSFARATAALLSLVSVGALFPAAGARAGPLPFDSDVRATGTINVGSTGQGGTQEDTNKRNLFVTIPKLVDDSGNESFALATLAMDQGHLTASDHACSGGAPTFGGSASGGGFVNCNQNYLLTSASLAPGTLVSVHFQFSSAARVIAAGTNLDFFNDSGGSGAHVAVNLATTDFFPTTLASVNGALNRTAAPDGNGGAVNQTIRSGNYEPDGGEVKTDFMIPVGSSLRLSIAADTSAGSTSLGNGAIDGDSQLSLVWGFDVGGDAQLTTDDMTPQPAPPASNGTPDQALLDLPDRPDTVPMPEPASLTTLLLCSLAPLARRPRHTGQ
jgi:hypothetical protein